MTVPPDVIALGEALVEIMRPGTGLPLDAAGVFYGPYPSGAPAIFADACARLNLRAGFIGTVGDDAFGRAFRGRLERDGVNLDHLATDRALATGTAFVAYGGEGTREFIFHLRHAAAGQAPSVEPAYFAQARWVHVTGSTLAGGAAWRAACIRAATLGKQHGAQISFDPNIRPELLDGGSVAELCEPILALADHVLPSGDELYLLTGLRDAEAAARSLFARGVSLVALKRGSEGCVGYTREGAIQVPSIAVEERDPTGAGDAFAAGLACALLRNLPLRHALNVANEVGARSVTQIGPMEGLPVLSALASIDASTA